MPEPHALTLRHMFAHCAADPRSPLHCTHRAVIIVGLADPTWIPTPDALPETWALVRQWHEEGLRRARMATEAHTRKEADYA